MTKVENPKNVDVIKGDNVDVDLGAKTISVSRGNNPAALVKITNWGRRPGGPVTLWDGAEPPTLCVAGPHIRLDCYPPLAHAARAEALVSYTTGLCEGT